MQQSFFVALREAGVILFKDWKQIQFIKFKGKCQKRELVTFHFIATATEHLNRLNCPFKTVLAFCGMKGTARVPSFKPCSGAAHVPYVTSFQSLFALRRLRLLSPLTPLLNSRCLVTHLSSCLLLTFRQFPRILNNFFPLSSLLPDKFEPRQPCC